MFSQTTTTQAAGLDTTQEHTEVVIDALGRVVIEGKGYTGDACSIFGDKLRSAFGGGGEKTDKPEAFADDRETVQEGPHW